MVGCPNNAKNTLVKNYLWLAEHAGAEIQPGRTVIDVRPLGAEDGSEGYAVTSVRTGAWFKRDRRVQRVRGVVVAGGALGTNRLLARSRLGGSLPRISARRCPTAARTSPSASRSPRASTRTPTRTSRRSPTGARAGRCTRCSPC
jgi:cholesterol oxidase